MYDKSSEPHTNAPPFFLLVGQVTGRIVTLINYSQAGVIVTATQSTWP